jgi:hypothetical protein
MKELTPRKLDFGYGGSRVIGQDKAYNEYLARRGANFTTEMAEIRGGNQYVYGFRIGGRLVVTRNENYIYKLNK